jgi:hypothetical protein
MTDIVEKLRSTQDNWNIPTAVVLDLQTAADEIVATRAERQRAQEACEQIAKRKDAEIERLRAALEFYADPANFPASGLRARKALKGEP